MRNESGVTLVEVFVVVSIVAMVSLAVLPFVGTFLQDTKAKAAAQQAAGALRQARQNALTAAATYTVTFGTAPCPLASAAPRVDDVPLGNRCPTNRPPDRVDDILANATMSASASPFMLGPLGGSTPAGTVQVSYGGTLWEVAINQIGGVRLCTPQCL